MRGRGEPAGTVVGYGQGLQPRPRGFQAAQGSDVKEYREHFGVTFFVTQTGWGLWTS